MKDERRVPADSIEKRRMTLRDWFHRNKTTVLKEDETELELPRSGPKQKPLPEDPAEGPFPK